MIPTSGFRRVSSSRGGGARGYRRPRPARNGAASDPERPEPEHRRHEPGESAQERDEGDQTQGPPPDEERDVPRGGLLDHEPAEGEHSDHVADRIHEGETEEQGQPQRDPHNRRDQQGSNDGEQHEYQEAEPDRRPETVSERPDAGWIESRSEEEQDQTEDERRYREPQPRGEATGEGDV